MRDHAWVPSHASDYLDGELPPREAARVHRHLPWCPECRELLHSLQTIVAALGTLRDTPTRPVAAAMVTTMKSHLGDTPPSGGR